LDAFASNNPLRLDPQASGARKSAKAIALLTVAGQMRETVYFEAMANVAAAGLLGKLCDQAGAE
jgi:hypothetical protein